MKKTLIVSAMALLALQAQAGVVVNNAATGNTVNAFETQIAGGNVAGLVTETGATYGERFFGQTLTQAGGFDVLTGAPSSPLSLLANATLADNIGITTNNSSNVIYGDLSNSVGEGALSILLSQASSVFGFDIIGTDGGAFTAQFFGTDGSLLASITQTLTGAGYFGFQTTGGDTIGGVSLTNTDPAGIGFDNFNFNRGAAVPERGTLAMVGLALAGLGFSRRKKA